MIAREAAVGTGGALDRGGDPDTRAAEFTDQGAHTIERIFVGVAQPDFAGPAKPAAAIMIVDEPPIVTISEFERELFLADGIRLAACARFRPLGGDA
ncbi:hypothetical protein JQ597_28850 [Bradyrhizobium sp. AUGA SZCCT0177]|nr:hypothetical protein [Bradyrhizobium sp. AUGA SZCCT0177]